MTAQPAQLTPQEVEQPNQTAGVKRGKTDRGNQLLFLRNAKVISGLIVLGFAHAYWLLLVGSALIGFGSAVFHPESSRVARLASAGRYGFAQATFQVGGNIGSAIGPILAAFVVLPRPRAHAQARPLIAFVQFSILTMDKEQVL